MKQKCIISRLKEPNIAHLYVIDPDQNLINNIRILCTKHPETIRCFIPEALFLDVTNGYPIPITAFCYNAGGRRLFEIDPLRVLSEQLADARSRSPYPERSPGGAGYLDYEIAEIGIYVKGHDLPAPEKGQGFMSRQPSDHKSAGAGYAGPGGASAGNAANGYAGTGSFYAGRTEAGRTDARREDGRYEYRTYYRNGDAANNPQDGPVLRKRKRKAPLIRSLVAAAVLIAVMTAGVYLVRESRIERMEESLSASNYSEAVIIYNEKVLGRQSREAKADPQIEAAISEIENAYLEGELEYEDAAEGLRALTGIGKESLSGKAGKALEEVEKSESYAVIYREGLAHMEEGEYVEAIRSFAQIDEASNMYAEAQEQLDAGIGSLIEAALSIESPDDYPEAMAGIEEALKIVPDYEALTKGREECRAHYEGLIRSSAIADADALAEEGDYAGAFERMETALETLPDDEALRSAMDQYHLAYVDHIAGEACAKVDAGEPDEASALVSSASEVYACDAFDSLASQIEETESSYSKDSSAMTADKTKFDKFSGVFKEKGDSKQFKLTAPASGTYGFKFARLADGLKVKILITAEDGSAVCDADGLTAGKSVACRLEEKRSYIIEITCVTDVKDTAAGTGKDTKNSDAKSPESKTSDNKASDNKTTDNKTSENKTSEKKNTGEKTSKETKTEKGSYLLTVGHPKGSVDVSEYDLVKDSMDYSGQQNEYTIIPEASGIYRFDLSGETDGFKLMLSVYDPAGSKVSGDQKLADGGGVTVRLEAGGKYRIKAAQLNKGGEYELSIGKPKVSEDASGKYILSDSLDYTDQRITYKYTAAAEGEYRITMGNMPEGCSVRLCVYDSVGDQVGIDEEMKNQDALSVHLDEGQSYEIQLIQNSGLGKYTMTICRERRSDQAGQSGP